MKKTQRIVQPRQEYPRPQFQRKDWINLNGLWSFDFDFGRSGLEKGFHAAETLNSQILVPFCPESTLSTVEYTDYLDSIWYQKSLNIPEEWSGKRILLHFGACDYESLIYLDGQLVHLNYGGSASFTVDLTALVQPGKRHNLVVNAKDDIRSATQPGGKQSLEFFSAGCFYTRVSGIWQTVWMEAVSIEALAYCEIFPDIDNNLVTLAPGFFEYHPDLSLRATVRDGEFVVTQHQQKVGSASFMQLGLGETTKLWSDTEPNLYSLELTLLNRDGEIIDEVSSYFGMRKIHIQKNQLFLNNQPLYLRMVLDQGFYPDGVWTSPDDASLKNDILLSKAAGFNGARLHQKVFEERFHYWADQIGYLTWAESPSWGLNVKSDASARNFIAEWKRVIKRDKNHPSIIVWTPLNETWDVSDRVKHRRLHYEVYEETKIADPTRPVNGASGGCQVVTDIYAVHIYEQDPAKLSELLSPDENGKVYATLGDKEVPYQGQPYIVDEFGGIKWIPPLEEVSNEEAWGYGTTPISEEEFYLRLEGQVDALLSHPHISGYCYTQLTDVEQEQNGLYKYDRSSKLDISRIFRIFSKCKRLYGVEHDTANTKSRALKA